MNTKARLLFVAITAILLLGAAQAATALPSMEIRSHASMAPVSIPVPRTGTTLIAITDLELATTRSGGLTGRLGRFPP